MHRYRGSDPNPNVIGIRLDSGGSLNFRRRNGNVDVYLQSPSDQILTLAHLTVDRLCKLGDALAALCTGAEVPNEGSPPGPEEERFALLEVD